MTTPNRSGSPQAASLPRSRRGPATRSFVPDGAARDLDLADTDLGGSWATIRFRDVGSAGVCRLVLSARVLGPDGRPGIVALSEEAEGGDRFVWTGRLPEGLRALRVTPLTRETAFHLDGFTIRRVRRIGLVARALRRNPRLTARAVYWRALGLKVRGRALLLRALHDRTRDRLRHLDRPLRYPLAGRSAAHPRRDRRLAGRTADLGGDAGARSRAARPGRRHPVGPRAALPELGALASSTMPRRIRRSRASSPVTRSRIRASTCVRRAENGHIARATNDALAQATGPFIAFLDHDDVLAEGALYHVAAAIRAAPELVLIYSDEDKIDGRGRRFEPHFKSGFDRELLYGQNYINHLTVIRTEAIRAVGGLRPGFEGSQDHDLLLRITARLTPDRIRHIPRILYHWRAAGGSGTFSDRALERSEVARLRALAEVAAPLQATAVRGPLGFNRLVRPVPEPAPLVSVIIPTRDRADLLAVALEGVLDGTDYPAIEVAHRRQRQPGDPHARPLRALSPSDPRVRVVSVPGPFNFSDLSNRGAAAARGALLLFLNNDVEVIEPGWLREMVSIALTPDIGAVGREAALPGPDAPARRHRPRDRRRGRPQPSRAVRGRSRLLRPDGPDPGSLGRDRGLPASAGCGLRRERRLRRGRTRRRVQRRRPLPASCARTGTAIVWTPHARLIHHESKSRGAEDTPEKRARFEREVRIMQDRWGRGSARRSVLQSQSLEDRGALSALMVRRSGVLSHRKVAVIGRSIRLPSAGAGKAMRSVPERAAPRPEPSGRRWFASARPVRSLRGRDAEGTGSLARVGDNTGLRPGEPI